MGGRMGRHFNTISLTTKDKKKGLKRKRGGEKR